MLRPLPLANAAVGVVASVPDRTGVYPPVPGARVSDPPSVLIEPAAADAGLMTPPLASVRCVRTGRVRSAATVIAPDAASPIWRLISVTEATP
jgi:hypothetical protein